MYLNSSQGRVQKGWWPLWTLNQNTPTPTTTPTNVTNVMFFCVPWIPSFFLVGWRLASNLFSSPTLATVLCDLAFGRTAVCLSRSGLMWWESQSEQWICKTAWKQLCAWETSICAIEWSFLNRNNMKQYIHIIYSEVRVFISISDITVKYCTAVLWYRKLNMWLGNPRAPARHLLNLLRSLLKPLVSFGSGQSPVTRFLTFGDLSTSFQLVRRTWRSMASWESTTWTWCAAHIRLDVFIHDFAVCGALDLVDVSFLLKG